ncbi:MAG: hypothetical protein QXH27_03830 [Candidatus Micrarchaeia archaeon]
MRSGKKRLAGRAKAIARKKAAAEKKRAAERKPPARKNEGFVYDLYGTLVLTDCLVTGDYGPRAGAHRMLTEQKRRGYRLACFADDDRRLVGEVLRKSGLAEAFDEVHYGNELDEEGLKDLRRVRFRVLSFAGDMPRDERAAEKYGVSFVKVPPFTVRKDGFDFVRVGKAIAAGVEGDWIEYARANGLRRAGDEHNVEFVGEGQRVKVENSRWVARFY